MCMDPFAIMGMHVNLTTRHVCMMLATNSFILMIHEDPLGVMNMHIYRLLELNARYTRSAKYERPFFNTKG